MSSGASDVNCTPHWQGTTPPAWLASHWDCRHYSLPSWAASKLLPHSSRSKYPKHRKEIGGPSNILSLKCHLLGKGRNRATFHKQETNSKNKSPRLGKLTFEAHLQTKQSRAWSSSQEETQLYSFALLFSRSKSFHSVRFDHCLMSLIWKVCLQFLDETSGVSSNDSLKPYREVAGG